MLPVEPLHEEVVDRIQDAVHGLRLGIPRPSTHGCGDQHLFYQHLAAHPTENNHPVRFAVDL